MNGIAFKLKKILQNRNTVTIIGVLLIMVLLYFGYNSQIEQAVTPLDVTVAAENIQPRTLITSQMVTTLSVPSIAVNDEVLLSSGLIVGKYTNVNAYIPKGSMFFKSAIVDEKSLPNYGLSQLKENEKPVYMKVDMDSTYGNSLLPDSYIDIYIKGESEDGKPFIAKLIEKVKIITVKDSAGKSVFENTSEDRIPSSILFGLDAEGEDNPFMMLTRATFIQNVNVVIVPYGGDVKISGETRLSSEALKEFIKANTADIDSTYENELEIDKDKDKNKTDSETEA